MKGIAICIDDYGLHPAVDEAIVTLVERSRVTTTSCMVGAPAWKDDAPRLKTLFDAGRVDAGLHIDVTEYPLDTGVRDDVCAWMRKTVLRIVDRERVRTEVRAQLDAFEAAMGSPPSHIDGHQHVHQFPVIRDIVVDEMTRRYKGNAMPWLRSTRGASRWRLKGRIIEAMGSDALAKLARERGIAQNTTLLGVYDFRGGVERFRSLMAQWLREARDGDLLMGHVANAIVPGDEIAQARVDEYRVFAHESFDAMLRDADVQPVKLSTPLLQ